MNDLTERLRRLTAGRDRAVVAGAAVTAAWLFLVALFWLFGPDGAPVSGLMRLLSLAAILLPVALIWMAVGLARAVSELRGEAMLLRAKLEMMRETARDGGFAQGDDSSPQAPQGRAATSPRAAARPSVRPAEARQSDLPFEQPPASRVSAVDLVAALNFPDGPDDHRAIAALRAALTDPEAARTIRAAQDVVTLLAQHGVYTDDLRGPSDSPELWRRFLDGQRGPALAGLTSPDDDEAAEIVAARLRSDEVFRDAVHHFLRQYDRMLTRTAPELGDAGLADLSRTRSGRAFGLLAHVTGIFG